MHHYPFHPGDYMLHTAHLEPLEDLAYRRILDLYYSSERPIPRETEQVARRLRLDLEIVNRVLSEFFELRETGWHQARCDAEIADYRHLSDVRRANGKRGGRPKKTKQVISANLDETGSPPVRPPVACNQNQNQLIRHTDNARAIPSLEQAKAMAGTVGVTEKEAEDWWHARESTDWTKGDGGGGRVKIGSMASDLKRFTESMREKKNKNNHERNSSHRRDSGNLNKSGRYA